MEKSVGADLSGGMNSLTRLGQQLLDGVDILLSGALILDESASMTMLSLAKMVPTAISSLMGTVVGVFNPQITIAYAEGDQGKAGGHYQELQSDTDFYYEHSHCISDGLWKRFLRTVAANEGS